MLVARDVPAQLELADANRTRRSMGVEQLDDACSPFAKRALGRAEDDVQATELTARDRSCLLDP